MTKLTVVHTILNSAIYKNGKLLDVVEDFSPTGLLNFANGVAPYTVDTIHLQIAIPLLEYPEELKDLPFTESET